MQINLSEKEWKEIQRKLRLIKNLNSWIDGSLQIIEQKNDPDFDKTINNYRKLLDHVWAKLEYLLRYSQSEMLGIDIEDPSLDRYQKHQNKGD